MKTRSSILVLATILICFGFSTVILQQNFYNPPFPPSGWYVQSTWGNWIWMNDPPPQYGFAHGGMYLFTPNDTGWTSLITCNFSAEGGEDLSIQISYRNNLTGLIPGNYAWQEVLRIGTTPVYTLDLDQTPNYPQWYQSTYTIPSLQQTSSEYNVAFKISGTGSSGSSVIDFDVDDVLITTGTIGVEPASLGQIKAAFQ